jgi:hypothetical protein
MNEGDFKILPGLIEDPRTQDQKDQDYKHSEIAPAAIALNWNRDISGAPKYSVRNQNGSGSCVAQSTAKALEILTGVIQSAHPIYRRRANFPSFGMYLQDSGEIEKKQGTTTEVLDPSQNMTEEKMDADVTVETPLKDFLYAFPNYQNIDEIAQAIELHKHCKITIGLTYAEYDNATKPVYDGKPAEAYHCLCGTYYFTDEAGEKCILIEESWGPNFITQRIFTESYLKARATGAMYHLLPSPPPPVQIHQFNTDMTVGDSGPEIVFLQNKLKHLGFFPVGIPSTGNYGNITKNAVAVFQKSVGINAVQPGQYCYIVTRTALNKININ